MLVIALSADAFAASFAYGSNKIKIPILSIQIINIICSSILGLSLFGGAFLKQYIPSAFTSVICFSILLILGIVKLFDSLIKSIIKKHNTLNKEIKFSMFNLNFILNLYVNPEQADADHSRVLSPIEASSLAVALSLDGLAIGFGAALGNINALEVFLYSLIITTPMIMLGCFAGNKTAEKLPFNLSWLSGVLLIVLAFCKL